MRLIAFLRAINVGGHVVRMEQLRTIVSGLGYERVETFIASGNVIFDGRATQVARCERAIERALRTALGYDVATFVRTDAEVAALAAAKPFPPAQIAEASTFCVAFLKAPLTNAQRQRLATLATDVDRFKASGRELFWLSGHKQNESKFTNAVFERVVGVSATFRGLSTVTKLSAKYPPGGPHA
jgi:uncharacterized protein (DUF1697 family)